MELLHQRRTDHRDARLSSVSGPLIALSPDGTLAEAILISTRSLSERFGRKFTLYLLWCILAVSITIECVAKTWQVWLVAKLTAGVGVGTLRESTLSYPSVPHSSGSIKLIANEQNLRSLVTSLNWLRSTFVGSS